jgi:hypothetical protein
MSDHKFEVDIDEGNSKPSIPFTFEFGPEFKVTKKDGKIRIEIDYEKFEAGNDAYQKQWYDNHKPENRIE